MYLEILYLLLIPHKGRVHMQINQLHNKIEKLRHELYDMLNNSNIGLSSDSMVKKSAELDLCICQYQELDK